MNDWQSVKACFAEKVLLDYTSMTGGEPATLTPGQIIDARQLETSAYPYIKRS